MSTGDGVVVNRTVDLYWGRCGRLLRCGSLLGMLWKVMALWISTGNGPVEYGAVDLYWGRCGRVCRFRSLLGTLW